MSDPRRDLPITIRWHSSKLGQLLVGDEIWGAIEWSDRRVAWCVEDAAGACLRHASSIHGQAAAREDAIALAEAMIRGGEFPAPEEVRKTDEERRQREREKRARQPANIKKRQRREREFQAWHDEATAQPFFELFAEAFDLSDPELWRSNSFAMLRPRLAIEVRAAIAKMDERLREHEPELARLRKISRCLSRTPMHDPSPLTHILYWNRQGRKGQRCKIIATESSARF